MIGPKSITWTSEMAKHNSRVKKAPEKSPDPQQYERSKALIQQLQDRETSGLCELWYFDVTGFCLTPYIPYAWQPIGSVIEIPTSTHSRRLNVLGFLHRQNDLYPHVIEGKVDTSAIVECFEQFSKQVKKRTELLQSAQTLQS
jgi:DDE superfamily endonuclease